MCITLFLYISLKLLHDYDVKMPNFTFYGGRKQATTKFSFSLTAVSKKSTPGKFNYIRHFQRIGLNAAKSEKTLIYFKSNVFTAVAVVDAKTPYCGPQWNLSNCVTPIKLVFYITEKRQPEVLTNYIQLFVGLVIGWSIFGTEWPCSNIWQKWNSFLCTVADDSNSLILLVVINQIFSK